MNHHIQIMTTLAERGGISLVPMLFSKSAYSKSSLREIPQQVSNKPWVSSHPNSNPRFCLSDNHPKLKLIFTTPSPVTPGGPSRNFFSLFCFSFFILGSSQKTQAHHLKYHCDVIYPGWLPISQLSLPQSGSLLAFTNHTCTLLMKTLQSFFFFFLDHRQFILKAHHADSKTWTRHISLDAGWSWIQRVCAYHAQALRMRPGERRETQLLQIFRVISVCAEEVKICGESQQWRACNCCAFN